MEYNDFTLVFQGPLHENFLYGLMNNYKEYTKNIVVSHWDTDKPELIEYLHNCGIVEEKNIICNKFKFNPNVFNGHNVYFQTLTTLNGLVAGLKLNTKYALKLRTDQWYGNLIPMFDATRNNPDKYNCVNFHFRPSRILKYHPSDKLIGMKYHNLLNTFSTTMYRIKNNVFPLMAGAYMYSDNTDILPTDKIKDYIGYYNYSDVNRKLVTQYGDKPLLGTVQILVGSYIGIVPEILFGTSFLMSKDIFPDPNRDVELIKEHFNIVKLENMLPYVNKNGTSSPEHDYGTEIWHVDEYDN